MEDVFELDSLISSSFGQGIRSITSRPSTSPTSPSLLNLNSSLMSPLPPLQPLTNNDHFNAPLLTEQRPELPPSDPSSSQSPPQFTGPQSTRQLIPIKRIAPIKCREPGCEESHTSGFRVRRHECTHTSNSFKCGLDGCISSFTSRKDLNRHRKGSSIHGANKAFSCPKCIATFSRDDNLKRHILSAHNQSRTYVST